MNANKTTSIFGIIGLAILLFFLKTCTGCLETAQKQRELQKQEPINKEEIENAAPEKRNRPITIKTSHVKYEIIHQERGVVDVVISEKITKNKIKRVIREVCELRGDYNTDVSVWKSKKYYKATKGNGAMIASYWPTEDEKGNRVYILTFEDDTQEDGSAATY